MATPATLPSGSLLDEKLKKSSPGKAGGAVFALMLVGGIFYIANRLTNDLSSVHMGSIFPYFLLGIALLIALGFEFVNGFHDTANAVATCIYTHSLEPHVAVVYSGVLNFITLNTVQLARPRTTKHTKSAPSRHNVPWPIGTKESISTRRNSSD